MLAPGYEISTDPARLDIDFIHRYLSEESYWARGMPLAVLQRSIAHSLCFGLFDPAGRQAGFARVITDRATFAWLADVFVDPAHRGRGLGEALVETIVAHPDLQGLRRFMLGTADAHELYKRHGFQPVDHPERLMEVPRPNPYGRG